jgi:hypothetical protein
VGHRANLLVIRDRRVELFYSHWRASTIPHDLFFGPAHAEAVIRAQRGEADGAHWLDDVWAEGGAIVDHDQRVFLFFGGEDLQYDVRERRVMLALMAHPWRGWQVRWAHEGIADLADHAGVPRAHVLVAETAEDAYRHDLEPPEEADWIDGVVSARLDDGSIRLFPTQVHRALLVHADAVRAACARGRGEAHRRFDSLPSAGTHVDLVRGTIEIWHGAPIAGAAGRFARHVPELRVIDHRDRFEAQLEACEGALGFDDPGEDFYVDKIRAALLRPARDFGGVIDRAIARPLAEGKAVEVNPFALRDDPVDVAAEARARIVDEAIAAYRARGASR